MVASLIPVMSLSIRTCRELPLILIVEPVPADLAAAQLAKHRPFHVGHMAFAIYMNRIPRRSVVAIVLALFRTLGRLRPVRRSRLRIHPSDARLNQHFLLAGQHEGLLRMRAGTASMARHIFRRLRLI